VIRELLFCFTTSSSVNFIKTKKILRDPHNNLKEYLTQTQIENDRLRVLNEKKALKQMGD
jgi:hypothetical protein